MNNRNLERQRAQEEQRALERRSAQFDQVVEALHRDTVKERLDSLTARGPSPGSVKSVNMLVHSRYTRPQVEHLIDALARQNNGVCMTCGNGNMMIISKDMQENMRNTPIFGTCARLAFMVYTFKHLDWSADPLPTMMISSEKLSCVWPDGTVGLNPGIVMEVWSASNRVNKPDNRNILNLRVKVVFEEPSNTTADSYRFSPLEIVEVFNLVSYS